MSDAFPARTKRQRVLININALVRGWDQEDDPDSSLDMDAMRRLADDNGLAQRELRRILVRLVAEGYLDAKFMDISEDPLPIHVWINDLTDKGLIEIGELPGAEDKLIEGLRSAIRAIEADDSLTEDEKRPKIDWLNQGISTARGLGTVVAAEIIVGGLPPA